MKKVLIVEDDKLIAELERDYLEAAGFQTQLMWDGFGLIKELEAEPYDALILDIMLPGQNGFALCREIRSKMNIPILLVTARKEDIDKIRGLGLGADDYISKPFSPSELVARVKAHIRIHDLLLEQRANAELNKIELGKLTVLPGERRVFINEVEKNIANKEFELLLFLIENPNIVFSKEDLFEQIWGSDSMGSTATVTVHVNRLREKLEESPSAPQYIQTVWGAGYRFKTA